MEKFFLKRLKFSVEVWQIILLLLAASLGVIGFGALVEKAATESQASPIARSALKIARLPAESRKVVKHILTNQRPTLAEAQRFEGQAGFKRLKDSADGALLLARYDGDVGRSVVEILDLEDGAVLHRYEPDIRDILNRSKIKVGIAELASKVGPDSFTISHPILTEDGGLIFQGMNTPLTRIDVCSNIVWMIDRVFHHSLERDAEGNYWSATYILPSRLQGMAPTWQDGAIVQISPDGEILFEKSVGEILLENDLKYLVHSNGTYSDDPLHLNDVQPALSDGPFWRQGDLFLSLRHRSAVVLYRPSTNKVIWLRQGPWTEQHDVDIVSDHEIAVFDNNTGVFEWGQYVLGVNDTVIYDFATDKTKRPFAEGYEANNIRTITEGLSEVLPDGEIFVEEQNYGRLLKMNAAGDLTWQYINRAGDGRNYVVNWSRYLDKTEGVQAAQRATQSCSAQ